MSYSIDRFISEIEARPAIWDSRTKEYSNRIITRNAWEELCVALEPNFEEKTIAEKCLTGTTLQKRWKSIRDAFSKELKKSNSNVPGVKMSKPYAYFDNLLFLKPLYETKPNKEQDNTDLENSIDDDCSNIADITVEVKPKNPQKRKKEESKITDNKNKKTRNMETYENDPDRHFLLSLLPDLQNMDPSIKFDVKFDIMNVLKSYKNYNNSYVEDYDTKTSISSNSPNASPVSVSAPLASTSGFHKKSTDKSPERREEIYHDLFIKVEIKDET